MRRNTLAISNKTKTLLSFGPKREKRHARMALPGGAKNTEIYCRDSRLHRRGLFPRAKIARRHSSSFFPEGTISEGREFPKRHTSTSITATSDSSVPRIAVGEIFAIFTFFEFWHYRPDFGFGHTSIITFIFAHQKVYGRVI